MMYKAMAKKALKYVVGIDEAGRGPIAGPVCVGLIIIKEKDQFLLKGIRDSKKLSEKQREEWFKKIKSLKREGKLDFSYKMISPQFIDKSGITKAITKAVHHCCSKVNKNPDSVKILLDGSLRAPDKFKNQETIIGGDDKFEVISAASVVAKVSRDRVMVRLAEKSPYYGFEKHKGYSTKEHYKKIKKNGLSKAHRRTFIN